MNYFDFGTGKIAYRSTGQGLPVVLLHGFCEDSRMWEEFVENLPADTYQFICMDLPGHGQSSPVAEASMELFADAVQALADVLSLPPFVLIGHSMGGYVGLAYAERYGSRLQGLGLFHSHPYADSEEKKEGRRKSIAFIEQHGHIVFVKQLIPKLFAPSFANNNSFLIDKLSVRASQSPQVGFVDALQAMIDRPDRSEVLRQLAAPVLFIVGEEDSAIPAEDSMAQLSLPAIASVHILPKVGHMGMFEARRKTHGIVTAFLQFSFNR